MGWGLAQKRATEEAKDALPTVSDGDGAVCSTVNSEKSVTCLLVGEEFVMLAMLEARRFHGCRIFGAWAAICLAEHTKDRADHAGREV